MAKNDDFGKQRLELLYLSFLPPFIPPAFLLISHLRDHRVEADTLLIDNSSQHSLVPRSPAAQMNSALGDQMSCTTHGSSCTEVEERPGERKMERKGIQLFLFRQPTEKRN